MFWTNLTKESVCVYTSQGCTASMSSTVGQLITFCGASWQERKHDDLFIFHVLILATCVYTKGGTLLV
jgi:hypothetical protein